MTTKIFIPGYTANRFSWNFIYENFNTNKQLSKRFFLIDFIKAKVCQFKDFFHAKSKFPGKNQRFSVFKWMIFNNYSINQKMLFEKFFISIGYHYIFSGRFKFQSIFWNNAFYSTDYFFLAVYDVDKQKSTRKNTLLWVVTSS